jgi:cardiolipin synthase
MSKKEYYKVRSKLTKDQILTIPNILSFFRIALIPVIVWLYVFVDSRALTTLAILISGATDIIDGFIARKFNMTSDFGKAIDPLADKLTQLAVLCCLFLDFPLIALPIVIMLIKEVSSFVLRFILFKKTERVDSAKWHGKVNTVLLHAIILLHVIWEGIPADVSNACILLSTAMMLLSCVLYSIDGIRALVATRKKPTEKDGSDNT